MNVLELADELDYEANRGQGMPRGAAHSQFYSTVAAMLRQQQSKIEALTQQIRELKIELQDIYDNRK